MPPVITVPPVNTAAQEGERVSLTCRAVGVPDPTIEWFFRDTERVGGVGVQLTCSVYDQDTPGMTVHGLTLLPGTVLLLCVQVFIGPTLVIEKMDISRTGVYTCAATNSDQGDPTVAFVTLSLYSKCLHAVDPFTQLWQSTVISIPMFIQLAVNYRHIVFRVYRT